MLTMHSTFQDQWKRFYLHYNVWCDGDGPHANDMLWPYSREFKPEFFVTITYNLNVDLCNFLAILIDHRRNPRQQYSMLNPGPTYDGLSSLRVSSAKADAQMFAFVEETLSYYTETRVFRPRSEQARAISQRVRAKAIRAEQVEALFEQSESSEEDE